MHDYKNRDNFNFYKGIGIDTFLAHAEKSGMDQCPDMEKAWPYIKDSDSILEIGAGYGRCVGYLIEKKCPGKIIALEQSEELLAYLKAHFLADNVEVVTGDINQFDRHVACAIWMWSGILDFSPEEQQSTIDHIYALLPEKGRLVIETPKLGIKTFADHIDQKHLHVEESYGSLDCYIPSHEEIHQYAKHAGFTIIAEEDYLTSTNKERSIYVLEK